MSAGPVAFMDLRGQLQSVRGEIDAAVARVLDSGRFILGPEVEAFESEMAARVGAAHCVAVANGTEALQLALEALGVGPGDEVVTSANFLIDSESRFRAALATFGKAPAAGHVH